MRKLIFQIMMTLDGFFEGPDKELDWHVWDEEMNEYSNELLNSVDTILFGRVTYELMAGFWPTQAAATEDGGTTYKMNSLQKVVFSKTLTTVNWNNTKLVSNDAVEEITKLKQQPGKDMVIFGSSGFASSLLQHDVINEYQLVINPVILSSGRTLFEGIHHQLHFKLLKTRPFKSGNVLLTYHLEKMKSV